MADGMDGAGIYALANKPTVALQSPMDALKSAGEAAAVVNANRLFRANVARGQIMRQAIDPATGMPNPAAANRLLAASTDPDVALVAPEAVNQAQALQGHQQEQALQRLNNIRDISGSLMADNGGQGPTYERLQQVLNAHKAAGNLTDQDIATAMAGMPTGNTARDMSTRKHILETFNDQAIAAQTRLTNLAGDRTSMSNGQVNQPGVVGGPRGPNYGAFTPAGPGIDVYPSRSELIGQRPGVDATTGAPIDRTTADTLGLQGRGDLAGPAGTQPGRVPSALLPPGYTGRYGSGRAGVQPAAAGGLQPSPPTVTPPAPDGAVQTGLAPGVTDEMKASAEHAVAARNEANTYQARMTPLLNAQEALKSAKTGVGAETLNSLRQRLANFTPGFIEGFRPLGGSPDSDAAFDEARKYLINYASNTPGANRSDAGSATASHANASTDISPQAAKYVVQAAIGMERMKQAQTLDFNASGKPGSQYDKHQAAQATNADPRAFIADQQSPAERKALLDKMTKEQRTNYLDSLRLGLKTKVLTLPGG